MLGVLGYTIDGQCSTPEQGIDITARHPEQGRLLVEAKGETSSKALSNRFGKPFNDGQVRHQVAHMFYTCSALRFKDPQAMIAMACPDTDVIASN